MGLLYRKDMFDDNKLEVPTTWDAYAEAALTLAKNKPGTFLTDFGAGRCRLGRRAMLWQKGWRPFHVDGTNIHIQLNDPIAKEWAAYWQKLIDAKAVDTAPVWTTEWFAGLDAGKYASWVTAAWGPTLMVSSMKASVGKWRAAPMPQYKAGDKVVSNWGGSTFAAFTTTPHLKEATHVRGLHGRRPGCRQVLEPEAVPVPGAKGADRRPGADGHQVRLLRRPGGERGLRRGRRRGRSRASSLRRSRTT